MQLLATSSAVSVMSSPRLAQTLSSKSFIKLGEKYARELDLLTKTAVELTLGRHRLPVKQNENAGSSSGALMDQNDPKETA